MHSREYIGFFFFSPTTYYFFFVHFLRNMKDFWGPFEGKA
jgi:hypothetical protein